MTLVSHITSNKFGTTVSERKKRLTRILVQQETLPPQTLVYQISKPVLKKPVLSEQFEENLELKLAQAVSPLEIFEIHQSCFADIVQSFPKYTNKLALFKEGYDELIQDLRNDIECFEKKHNELLSSTDFMTSEMKEEQLKSEQEMEQIGDLMEKTKKMIFLLESDINDLQPQVTLALKTNRTIELKISELQTSINSLEPLYEKHHKNCTDLKTQLQEITDELNQYLSQENKENANITAILDRIKDKHTKISDCKKHKQQINNQIKECEQKIQKQEKELQDYEQRVQTIRDEKLQYIKSFEDISNSKANLLAQLRILFNACGIGEWLRKTAGDDPQKMIALYLSYKDGYRAGIDPLLFPDLV